MERFEIGLLLLSKFKSRFIFFRRGLITGVLSAAGKTPDTREPITICKSSGLRQLRKLKKKLVGIGSRYRQMNEVFFKGLDTVTNIFCYICTNNTNTKWYMNVYGQHKLAHIVTVHCLLHNFNFTLINVTWSNILTFLFSKYIYFLQMNHECYEY